MTALIHIPLNTPVAGVDVAMLRGTADPLALAARRAP
jgi:hypothetical protein